MVLIIWWTWISSSLEDQRWLLHSLSSSQTHLLSGYSSYFNLSPCVATFTSPRRCPNRPPTPTPAPPAWPRAANGQQPRWGTRTRARAWPRKRRSHAAHSATPHMLRSDRRASAAPMENPQNKNQVCRKPQSKEPIFESQRLTVAPPQSRFAYVQLWLLSELLVVFMAFFFR